MSHSVVGRAGFYIGILAVAVVLGASLSRVVLAILEPSPKRRAAEPVALLGVVHPRSAESCLAFEREVGRNA